MDAYDYRTQLKLKSQDAIIHFDEGLIGFSEFKDYVLMESESLAPFRLLQSLDSPKVGFLVLEAAAVIRNYYELVPPREWESLGINLSDMLPTKETYACCDAEKRREADYRKRDRNPSTSYWPR